MVDSTTGLGEATGEVEVMGVEETGMVLSFGVRIGLGVVVVDAGVDVEVTAGGDILEGVITVGVITGAGDDEVADAVVVGVGVTGADTCVEGSTGARVEGVAAVEVSTGVGLEEVLL